MAATTPAPASPTTTLSAALDEDRRRDAHSRRRRRQGLLTLSLRRWGTAFLPKSGAAVARDLEAARRARTPNPSPPMQPRTAPPVQKKAAVAVNVAERRPLREREDSADVRAPTAESKPNAVAPTTPVAAAGDGDHCTGSATPSATFGRGGSIWVRVLPKAVTSLPLQVDSPQTSSESPAAAGDTYVWADKYRPNFLMDFICNKDAANELHRQVIARECKHLIFEGPHAVGKKSMVRAFVRDAVAPDEIKIEEQTKRIELKGEMAKHIDVKVKISAHHVEINLADLHGYEKHVITTLLTESVPPQNSICGPCNCRVIVVYDADKLPSDLQHYIGWFLGRYVGCSKMIFCCSDASNLEAVRHLFKVMTLNRPSRDEIIKVLEYIATQENIALPPDIARRITKSADNNLRQAIRSFEATWKANYSFIEDQTILTGWEDEISNVAKKIMEEPSPKQLFVIRGKIRKLIEHNVPPSFIFCNLVNELKRDMDEEFQSSIDNLASEWNRCKECMLQKEQCTDCKSRDTTLEIRNINIESFYKEVHDQGETIQCFIKIEEFTVRFMSFYRSLKAKNTIRGGVP